MRSSTHAPPPDEDPTVPTAKLDSVDIPIEVDDEPVRLRPRVQGTIPPHDHVPKPLPFVLTPSPVSANVSVRAIPSLVAPAPTRLAIPPAADGGEEPLADGWFRTDRTAEVRDLFDPGWTTGAPLQPPSRRSRILPWLVTAVSAVCIASLAFVIVRHDLEGSPSAAKARPAEKRISTPPRAERGLAPTPPLQVASVPAPAQALPPASASASASASTSASASASTSTSASTSAPAAQISGAPTASGHDMRAAPVVQHDVTVAPVAAQHEVTAAAQHEVTAAAQHDVKAPVIVAQHDVKATSAPVATEAKTSKPRPRVRASGRHAPVATGTKAGHATKAGNDGTLMVSSKPPCDIVIDGVATVLTTPQRSLKLPAGKHTLTLFNLRLGVDVTLPIVIEARKTTKVIRNLMPGQR